MEGTIVFVRTKAWWVQAEGLKALMTMARLHPHSQVDYTAHLLRLWDYVKAYVIDSRRGGWLAAGLDTNPDARNLAKATMWKDSSRLPADAHAGSAAEAVRIGGLALRLRAARGLRHEPAKLLRLPSVGLHLFLGKTALQP